MHERGVFREMDGSVVAELCATLDPVNEPPLTVESITATLTQRFRELKEERLRSLQTAGIDVVRDLVIAANPRCSQCQGSGSTSELRCVEQPKNPFGRFRAIVAARVRYVAVMRECDCVRWSLMGRDLPPQKALVRITLDAY